MFFFGQLMADSGRRCKDRLGWNRDDEMMIISLLVQLASVNDISC